MEGKGVFRNIGEFISDLFHGKIITRYNVPDIFPSIVFAFILVWLTILMGYGAQRTMSKVERNKKILNELKIKKAQKTIELASFNRISTIEKLLKQKDSDVQMPEKPATIIKK